MLPLLVFVKQAQLHILSSSIFYTCTLVKIVQNFFILNFLVGYIEKQTASNYFIITNKYLGTLSAKMKLIPIFLSTEQHDNTMYIHVKCVINRF